MKKILLVASMISIMFTLLSLYKLSETMDSIYLWLTVVGMFTAMFSTITYFSVDE